MSETLIELYALAGELCQIEADMRESWTFALVSERSDVLRRIGNLVRRDRTVRPAVSSNGRECFAVYR
jgi:hypothetical protein